MTVLYVDDERSAHTIFRHSLGTYADIMDVSYHFDYNSAIDYAKSHQIDCAFLDITLVGQDGIALARALRELQPNIEFAFITGYDEFARAAYDVGGRAYLTKPYSKDALHAALGLMERLIHPWVMETPGLNCLPPLIFAKTFGSFDLLVNGVPLHFKHVKAKELLAYLIHQMGGFVTSAQVFYALWDRQTYTRDNSTYVRRTIRTLREELKSFGLEDILVVQRNAIRVDIRLFSCDAYALLSGSTQAADAFDGAYMSQYPWAQASLTLLERAVAATTPSQS